MAWTVPTYAGTYMGGTPSNARTAMFELCRAVNERQAALALTKTEFFKADGTEAADITLADILNIRAAGVESNAEKNLKRVRGAIIAMLAGASFDPVFTTTSLGNTALTKAAVETAIGTDLDANPIRPQEARYWQAMQDALDLMIYARRYRGELVNPAWVGISAARMTWDVYSASGSPPRQTAWTTMLADSPTSVDTGLSSNNFVQATLTSGSNAQARDHVSNVGLAAPTSGYFDDVASCYAGASVSALGTIEDGTITTIDVDLDGDTHTISLGAIPGQVNYLPISTTQIPLAAARDDITLAFIGLPGTVPFSADDANLGVMCNLAWCHFDLTSILSDQA